MIDGTQMNFRNELVTADMAEAELHKRGIPFLAESRRDLTYRYHYLDGPGWVIWSMGRAYLARTKRDALIRLLEATA